MTKYAEKMQYRHPPIQEHLVSSHRICMYMYIYLIYTAHILYVCILSFSEVTILFSQFHYCGEYRGEIPGGHSNLIYLVRP